MKHQGLPPGTPNMWSSQSSILNRSGSLPLVPSDPLTVLPSSDSLAPSGLLMHGHTKVVENRNFIEYKAQQQQQQQQGRRPPI